jgi:hypothetical protein
MEDFSCFLDKYAGADTDITVLETVSQFRLERTV